jgi:hypothetical protein
MALIGYLFYSTTIKARLCVPLLSKFQMTGLLSYFLGCYLQEWCVTNGISVFRVEDQACDDIFQMRLLYYNRNATQLMELVISSPNYSFVTDGF